MICTVIVYKEDDTYMAKDVRTNIVDQGDTTDEALNSLREALELYYEDSDGNVAIVPMHKKDLKTGTLKSILEQADMTIEEFKSFF